MMRIAVLGRTHWLLDAARRALRDGHQIALVATAPPAPEYRARAADFAILAREAGASFHENPDCNAPEFVAALQDSGAEIAISVNWPKLIGEAACEALPRGILNAHAGDLPRYRGNACPNWAIINGEPHVGLCVHAMDPEALDAGPVFARVRFLIADETDIGDVYAWLDTAIPEQFAAALKNAATPGFSPEDQRAPGVRPLRCQPRRPEDGAIDWRESAAAIHRLVRASGRPFAGAYSFLECETKVVVWKARIVELDYDLLAVPGQILGKGANGPLVACGDGVVELVEAELASGGPVPTANRFRLRTAR